jgi:hypothetical protein
MQSKYNLIHLDHNEWKKLHWYRNTNKENNLYYNVLNLKDDSKYTLFNKYYADPRLGLSINTICKSNNKVINLDYIDRYTLLDWAKVIENASEIHTVQTSILFMIEVLYKKNMNNVHIYHRPIDTASIVESIGDIINKDWQIH